MYQCCLGSIASQRLEHLQVSQSLLIEEEGVCRYDPMDRRDVFQSAPAELFYVCQERPGRRQSQRFVFQAEAGKIRDPEMICERTASLSLPEFE